MRRLAFRWAAPRRGRSFARQRSIIRYSSSGATASPRVAGTRSSQRSTSIKRARVSVISDSGALSVNGTNAERRLDGDYATAMRVPFALVVLVDVGVDHRAQFAVGAARQRL